MKKKYPCVPMGAFLPWFFTLSTPFCIRLLCSAIGDGYGALTIGGCILFIFTCVSMVCFTWRPALQSITIEQNRLVCSAPLCKEIIVEYSKCCVGIDYHLQNGRPVWWIYICTYPYPPYNLRDKRNGINATPCRDGFIRIIYRDEIFCELMKTLPKEQRKGLESAARLFGLGNV